MKDTKAIGRRCFVAWWGPLGLSILTLLSVALFATAVGSVDLSLRAVAQAVWNGVTGQVESKYDVIVWQIRVPRVLLAGMVGGALAVSGATYQGVFRNPLAEPYLLGVASGAALGATLVMAYGAGLPLLVGIGLPVTAFVFGLVTVALVMFLARQGRRLPVLSLILAGAVLSAIFTAVTSFVMLAAREQAAGILAWLLGSFSLASWTEVFVLLPLMLAAVTVIGLSGRYLNLLQLGETQAAQLGVNVETTKLVLVSAATLATAAAVSVSGIIGFVGLMVPHAARLAFGPDHRALIPLALVLGALFMILADLVARTLIAPAEIPIGVITAVVGGPFFLFLLRKQRVSR
jgi:iron complex transport system permease protein